MTIHFYFIFAMAFRAGKISGGIIIPANPKQEAPDLVYNIKVRHSANTQDMAELEAEVKEVNEAALRFRAECPRTQPIEIAAFTFGKLTETFPDHHMILDGPAGEIPNLYMVHEPDSGEPLPVEEKEAPEGKVIPFPSAFKGVIEEGGEEPDEEAT